MQVALNLRNVKKMLLKKSLYAFIKEFWDAYETDKLVDHWLIEYQSECFMYSVKHFLPAYVWASWITDEEYEKLKEKNNAVCPVRDKMFNGQHVHNHDWNMPPRHMKSSIMNVCGPVWLSINCPIKVASVSHTRGLSDEMNTKRQKLFESEKYDYYFCDESGLKLTQSSSTSIRLKNGSQLYSVCQASFTGFGADLIICDDLISSVNAQKDKQVLKNAVEFFRKTVPTRLNNKTTGVIWQIQQRLGNGDISGNVLKDKNLLKTYSHTELQAEASRDITLIYPCTGKIKVIKKGDLLWQERFGDYTGIKMEVGVNEFETQYNQNPKNSELNVIKEDMIHWIDDKEFVEFKKDAEYHYASHDCPVFDKITSDFHGYNESYGKLGELVITGAWEKKMGYVKEKQLMQDLYNVYPEMLQIIENKANGASLQQDLKTAVPGIITFEPDRSKAARLELASIYMKNGSVRFVKNAETEYLVERLLEFPLVEHDDIIDAFSQAVIYHFQMKQIGVYTGSFTFENIIPDIERKPNEQVFYEFAANMVADKIKVIAVNHDLAHDEFIVEKEFVFTNLPEFENFCRENAKFGNLFIDASIQSRLKSVIFSNVVYLTTFNDEDKDSSVNLIRAGFYKKKIKICNSCVNTRTDVARLRFTNESVEEGVNKVSTLDEGFAGCIRALVTYDKGTNSIWY